MPALFETPPIEVKMIPARSHGTRTSPWATALAALTPAVENFEGNLEGPSFFYPKPGRVASGYLATLAKPLGFRVIVRNETQESDITGPVKGCRVWRGADIEAAS
jgi:hypothetical protein